LATEDQMPVFTVPP